MICKKFLVTGAVQGVGFRLQTQRLANRVGVVGYAKNLETGEVEILACGSEVQIGEVEKWLRAGGPVTAKVEDVRVKHTELTDTDMDTPVEFDTL